MSRDRKAENQSIEEIENDAEEFWRLDSCQEAMLIAAELRAIRRLIASGLRRMK